MSYETLLSELNRNRPLVNPSLLASNFANLADEIRQLELAGAKVLHLDIMDGHFVPNISFGVPIVRAVRRMTDLPLDVHLMITEPGQYIKSFRNAGADIMTVHLEVAPDPRPLLDQIHALGAAAGVALNPPTEIEPLLPYLDHCDVILPMSVMPGFGGQSFQESTLDKLRWLKQHARPDALLEVDGGVNPETIRLCAEAGATLFVTGTSLLDADDVAQQFEILRQQATVV